MLEKMFEQLASQQDMLSQIIGIVRNLASGTVLDQTSLPEGVNLPVISVEDMDQINEALADEGSFTAMVKLFFYVEFNFDKNNFS